MMSQVDLDALEKLHAAADLRELESVHITSQGYEHLANLIDKLYQEGRDWQRGWPVCMTKKEWSDSIAAAHNALPALIAELRELRELVGCATRFQVGRCVVLSDISSWWRLIAPGYGDAFATLPAAIEAARKWEADHAV